MSSIAPGADQRRHRRPGHRGRRRREPAREGRAGAVQARPAATSRPRRSARRPPWPAPRLQVVTLRATYDQQKLLLASAEQTAAYAAQGGRPPGRAGRRRACRRASRPRKRGTRPISRPPRSRSIASRSARPSPTWAARPTSRSPIPAVQQARAAQEATRITLSYTTVVAPTDGIVARVDQLQKGAYVNPAQTLFYLLSGQPWIEANFKERPASQDEGGPAREDRHRRPGRQGFRRPRAELQPRRGRRVLRRCRPRTRPATGSRSCSACPCGSPSTAIRRRWRAAPA